MCKEIARQQPDDTLCSIGQQCGVSKRVEDGCRLQATHHALWVGQIVQSR
jgi:hypothetical protein